MVTDWRQAEIDRLGRRIDRLERQIWDERERAREEKRHRSERVTRAFQAILWLELAAIWAFSIARAAGAA